MAQKEVFVSRGSVELVVIGLLAALVVLIAFPMISGFTAPEEPPQMLHSEAEQVIDPLPVD